MGILNKKTSKKKEEVKTAQAYHTDKYEVYIGSVDCPHCGFKNFVEKDFSPPTFQVCINEDCNKQFNIEWE